jgi:hypothetical protein
MKFTHHTAPRFDSRIGNALESNGLITMVTDVEKEKHDAKQARHAVEGVLRIEEFEQRRNSFCQHKVACILSPSLLSWSILCYQH